MTQYQLKFLTPLFSKGSIETSPEIRPPSIRGQLHWWFRALGGSYNDEKDIFGGVHGKAIASKVVVRVSNIQGHSSLLPTLPHKTGDRASHKSAFTAGTTCDLYLSQRLGGLNASQLQAFNRTVEAWLLLGTLGLRGTRAAGSFAWVAKSNDAAPMPQSLAEWKKRCSDVLNGAPLKFHITSESFTSAEEARRVVSDTIGGIPHADHCNTLNTINWPLGNVSTKDQKKHYPFAPGRKTSPLRFRIIPIGNRFHIAALWDDRSTVTGNQTHHLKEVIRLLQNKNKTIGKLLADFS